MKRIVVSLCIFGLTIIGYARNGVKESDEKMEEVKKILSEVHVPEGVYRNVYLMYILEYNSDFEFGEIDSEIAKLTIAKYFGKTEYRTIWFWDIDGDGLKEYLSVELCPKLRRAIKRGVCVDEKGTIKLFIDTKTGIYTPDYKVIDLKKIGCKNGEVECYTIGFTRWDGTNKKNNPFGRLGKTKMATESIKENERSYGRRLISYTIGTFNIQRIDKDLHVIGTEYCDQTAGYRATDYITLLYFPWEDKTVYYYADTEFKNKRKLIEEYRKLKKKGKTYSPPQSFDFDDVKKAELLYYTDLYKYYNSSEDRAIGGEQ